MFAGRLLKEKGWNPNALVQRAFRLATGREPTAQETQIAARFLSEQSALLRATTGTQGGGTCAFLDARNVG